MDRQAISATARQVWQHAKAHDASFKAAGITYYALVSWIPVLLLGFVGATVFFGEEAAQRVILLVEGAFTPEGVQLIETLLTGRAGAGGVTVFSAVLLLWSAVKLFRSIDTALTAVAGKEQDPSWAHQVTTAAIALVLVTVAVAVTVAATVFSGFFLREQLVDVAATTIQFTSLVVVFSALYRVFLQLPVRQLVPGAVGAAAGWSVLQVLFSVYLSISTNPVYGVFGGILAVVVWLYLGNLLVLYGAVVNTVFAGNAGTRRGHLP